jgi:protein phosphatase
MLNCPVCNFENPDDHAVCDQCGQPLQRWCSIIWPGDADPIEWAGDYLDAGERYQRLGEPLEETITAGAESVTQLVLDCQPTLDSPLKELQALWLDQPTLDPTSHPEIAALPPQALPYLALQADYFPSVPELHDALQTNHTTILVLEDRSTWPTLVTVWPTKAIDPLQQTQWLFEITLLWQALAPWQAQATLLNPQRLVLSPNALLCLNQVDIEPDRSPTLQALGQTWQQFLVPDPIPLAAALKQVIGSLANGTLSSLSQLQAALAELAGQYRTADSSTLGARGNAMAPTPELSSTEPSLSDEDLIQLAEAQALQAEADNSNDGVDLPTMILPMKLIALEDNGQSHVGQQRSHNEDWFFSQTEVLKVSDPVSCQLRAKGLYILCDGMGGHASGEVASQLAVTTLQTYFAHHWAEDLPDRQTLSQAVVEANQAIFNANQAKASSGIGRMGTTLVMVLVHNLQMAVVHVGDSRLYSYSKRVGLKQLTIDHEVGQREINRGVEPAIAYARPDAYQLTQALGPRHHDYLKPGINYYDITEDTLFILCSDGLSDNDLLERHEASHIAPLLRSKVNLEEGGSNLIQLANEKNGHDNITTILVRLKLRPDIEKLAR